MTEYPRVAVERAMTRREVMLRAMSGAIHWFQAAEILGMSPRSLRRWRERYQKFGYEGLYDHRWKRPSPRRVPMELAEKVLQLYREQHQGFNVRHFHDLLKEEHGIRLSYTWVKTALRSAGLVAKHRQRGPHRQRRPRRPLPGMLVHLDGSEHAWFPLEDQRQDLLAVMDDATSQVYYARFVEEESTRTVMEALRAVVAGQGLFCSLYTDRASHFVTTRKAGEAPDREVLTEVARALDQLGIELIPANSPQARGRSERLFGTWQGRLPQELRRRGIATYAAANQFLDQVWIPFHNRRFAVPPEQQGTAFLPCRMNLEELNRVFSLHHPRVVANDNTVRVRGLVLQIPPSPQRFHFVRSRVIVYEHLDQTFSVARGPHLLGRFDREGNPLRTKTPHRKVNVA